MKVVYHRKIDDMGKELCIRRCLVGRVFKRRIKWAGCMVRYY